MIVVPLATRKAVAFVEAIAKIEVDFGFVIAFGLAGEVDDLDAVTFGPGDAFAIVRRSGTTGDLALAVAS